MPAVTQKDYLELVQDAIEMAGVEQTSPSNVTDTDHWTPRFAKWLDQSYQQLQLMRDWYWRLVSDEMTLSTGASTLDLTTVNAIELVPHVDNQGSFLYIRDLTGETVDVAGTAGQGIVRYIKYSDWLVFRRRLEDDTDSAPQYFTVLPDQTTVQFETEADVDYGVDLNYLKDLEKMTANTDTMLVPKEYQDIVIWDTVRKYGTWSGDDKATRLANLNYTIIKRQMERRQVSEMEFKPARLY